MFTVVKSVCCTVPNAEDNQCCPTKTACVTVLLFITDSSVTRWLPGCSKHCNSTRASDVFWVLKVTRSFLHCISLYYVRQCTEFHIFVINQRTLQTPNICRSWLSQILERFQSFQQTSRWKEMSIQSSPLMAYPLFAGNLTIKDIYSLLAICSLYFYQQDILKVK